MSTYYISPDGSDSNNGLGPDASAVTNKPWLTIGKALGASGISSGDTVYIAPGAYREVVTVAMTSAAAETFVLGDPLNAQGFKNGSGTLLSEGYVRWTAYTTNDTTAPSASSLLSLAGRDHLTFQDLLLQGGSNSTGVVDATSATSTDIKFKRCVWLPSGGANVQLFNYTGIVDAASNVTIERCVLFGWGGNIAVRVTLPTSASADYDSNIRIVNSILFNGAGQTLFVTASGASSFKGGGVDLINSLVIHGNRAFDANSANLSTTNPCTANNNIFFACTSQATLAANTSGQLTEDYNIIYGGTPRSNVSAGANSISNYSYAAMIELVQSWLWGMTDIFPFGMPMASSPFLLFGGTGAPSDDLFGETRPGTPAVGPQERTDLSGGPIGANMRGGFVNG